MFDYLAGSADRLPEQDLSRDDCHCPVHVGRVKTTMPLRDFAEARPSEPFRGEQRFRGLILLLHAGEDFFQIRCFE